MLVNYTAREIYLTSSLKKGTSFARFPTGPTPRGGVGNTAEVVRQYGLKVEVGGEFVGLDGGLPGALIGDESNGYGRGGGDDEAGGGARDGHGGNPPLLFWL